MSVSHSDFADFAAKLAEANTEIEWRNSASRSYYGSYHRALQSAELCPDNSHLRMGTHERLADRFFQHADKAGKAICYILKTMKRHRTTADYELSDHFAQSTAKAQAAQYSALVQRLDDFDAAHQAKQA
jgi:hypothetical protein